MIMVSGVYKKIFLLFITVFLIHGCIEPYEFEAETFENVLVLEATLTDEFKRHEVLLYRSFRVDENEPVAQTLADVTINDDTGNEFPFIELEPGRYESIEEFAAEEGRSYQLSIVTPEGDYESTLTPLATSSGIDEVYATRTTFNGEDGVALLVDNYNTPQASRYYRYKYEETYKIISRFSYNFDLIYDNGMFVEVLKTKEERTCYNTLGSNDIILGSTTSLQSNDLEGFLVRFINKNNPISSRRYSILVKQYALSPEAFGYYETLKKLSGSDNIFSQAQPGFIKGNVYNVNDPEEKVVGMFNVSSYSSKRIYFNYTDFYGPEDTRPHFTNDCKIMDPQITGDFIAKLARGDLKYWGPSAIIGGEGGPYMVVNGDCIDCTRLGTNEIPDFWEEE